VRADAVDLQPVLHHRRPVPVLARAAAGADQRLRAGAGRGEVPGLPILLSLLARLGGEARLYRAMFLEEIGKDYVRTARAKGLSEAVVLFRHVLRNALIPIITSAGSYLPYVFLGSLVFESFFGIPGLGAFVIEAITGQDFAIVRTMVFLGALLYIASNVLIDIAYTWADPRVRLS
jgi:peptide/nickel transport system permease protein